MHRGGCCGGFRRQPITVDGAHAQAPAAAEGDAGSEYDANEAVYTPRTEEFVHVDNVYSGIDPPAYDVADGKGYADEKKGAAQ